MRLVKEVFLLLGVCIAVSAISNTSSDVKNTITEEERRGSPIVDAKLKKEPEKNTRGAYSSATKQHNHYYIPSAIDSHVASTGHGLSSSSGSGGSSGGGGGGYDHSGPSAGGHSSTSSHSSSSSHGFHASSPYGHGYSGYGSSHGGSSLGGGHGSSLGGHGSPGHGSSGFGGGSPSLSYGGSTGHGHGVSSLGGHGISIGHGFSSLGNGLSYGHGGGGFGYGHGGSNALKSLLIPLAGIALLGAAAAFSTNPVLLQLGVVNGRRKRSITNQQQNYYPVNPYLKPDN